MPALVAPRSCAEETLDISDSSDDQRRPLPTPEELRQAGLSSAEMELVPPLVANKTLTEIADVLGVERETILLRSSSIYKKLGISALTDATD
jgi:DNA-binding NarL/FixJ family response regulator